MVSNDDLALFAFSSPDEANSIPFAIKLLMREDCALNPLIISSILLVAYTVFCAKARTSSATTENPRPASPARADSIAAFNASKLV